MENKPFLKLMRGPVGEQLLRHPKAFTLLTLAALRARRTGEIRLDDLKPGEAMMGDYEACGNTRQEFRTNLERLKGWGIITTRSTTRGTVVTVSNTEVYDLNSVVVNQPSNQPATNDQPTINQLVTTNKNLLLEIEQLKDVLHKQEEQSKQRLDAAAAAWRGDQKKIGELEGQVIKLAAQLEAANASASHTRGARPRREPRPKAPKDEPPDFVKFYEAYPKHEKRQEALAAWLKLSEENRAAAMQRAHQWFADRPDLADPARRQYIPSAATWLNGARWTDEPPLQASPGTQQRQHHANRTHHVFGANQAPSYGTRPAPSVSGAAYGCSPVSLAISGALASGSTGFE